MISMCFEITLRLVNMTALILKMPAALYQTDLFYLKWKIFIFVDNQ